MSNFEKPEIVNAGEIANGSITPAKISTSSTDNFTFPGTVGIRVTADGTVCLKVDADTLSTGLSVSKTTSGDLTSGQHTKTGCYFTLDSGVGGSTDISAISFADNGGQFFRMGKDSDNKWKVHYGNAGFASGTNPLCVDSNNHLGCGTDSPSASAQLEVASTTAGILPPRMTTTQKNAISSPAEGLMVYDLTLHKLCVFTGSAWETVTSA